jgi:hypothetical protein
LTDVKNGGITMNGKKQALKGLAFRLISLLENTGK